MTPSGEIEKVVGISEVPMWDVAGEERVVETKVAMKFVSPSSEEIRRHTLTHQPYRNWRDIAYEETLTI